MLATKFYLLAKKLSPTHILIIAFLLIQFVGCILLWLPISSKTNGVSFIDAFFTATSALCVTGLIVKNTLWQWSLFGKLVIMTLIEIGGLGFMTIIAALFILIGKKITLKERLIIQESLNQLNYKGIVAFVKKISCWVLVMQGFGALVLSVRFMFLPDINFYWAIFLGVFHSISAYCNAGFDLIGNNNMVPFVNDITVNLTVMILITLGGIGYVVIEDCFHVFIDLAYKKLTLLQKFERLKLHSKLVIISSIILTFCGAALIFMCEFTNPATLANSKLSEKIFASFFQSVSARTAGFNSISEHGLRPVSKLITIILMFIGGSPGGTAGGVKTVTFAVLVLSVINAAKGSNRIEVFERTISFYNLQKALTITFFNFAAIFISSLLLSIFHPNLDFLDIIFETSSAVGTVGLTVGVMSHLSTIGKLIICIDMMIGKLGPISIAVALFLKRANTNNIINYPQEKVIIG